LTSDIVTSPELSYI